MTLWTIVIVASALTLLAKLLGWAVPGHLLERPRVGRIADLLTVALLAALLAVQTLGSGQDIVWDARLPAVGAAAVMLAFKVPFIVVVFGAAAIAALLRFMFPGAL